MEELLKEVDFTLMEEADEEEEVDFVWLEEVDFVWLEDVEVRVCAVGPILWS